MGTCLEFDPTKAIFVYKKTVEATMVKGFSIINEFLHKSILRLGFRAWRERTSNTFGDVGLQ